MLPQLYKTFQDWSAKGSVWIYSDPHFGDSDCKFMDPNWITPEEQVKKINDKVKKDDTLILLGDIGDIKYIQQLKVQYKVLITGNHDKGASFYKKEIKYLVYYKEEYKSEVELYKALKKDFPNFIIKIYEEWSYHAPFKWYSACLDNKLFNEVYTGPLFISDKILLSHEPIDIPFGLNIHGHVHDGLGGLSKDNSKYNVCSNCINYEPQNLSEIIKSGCLKNRDTIHRLTIDKATKKKKQLEGIAL